MEVGVEGGEGQLRGAAGQPALTLGVGTGKFAGAVLQGRGLALLTVASFLQ